MNKVEKLRLLTDKDYERLDLELKKEGFNYLAERELDRLARGEVEPIENTAQIVEEARQMLQIDLMLARRRVGMDPQDLQVLITV